MIGRTTSIAVDWSGAEAGVRSKLWVAEVQEGRVVTLESGRTREQLVDFLIGRSRVLTDLLVGLDFAFSFPAWFLRQLGLSSARELWPVAARRGESWLAACVYPFWGRSGRPRPPDAKGRSPYRRTESDRLPVGGVGPKSVFQIGGAGSVGTGSIRGMPYLSRLRAAGFSVWPFDPPRRPVVFEIYPRYLTGVVNKSSLVARSLYLETHFADQQRKWLRRAESCEDAFDAVVSALCIDRFSRDPFRGHSAVDERDRLEGRIWSPWRDPVPCAEVRARGERSSTGR